MNTNKLFLDIETLPPQGGGYFDRIKAAVRAPGQYKKPDSIAQWLAENADAVALEEFGKLGLDGLYGQIACVGFALNDEPVRVISVLDYAAVEDTFLYCLFKLIEEAATDLGGVRSLSPVGHNIDFDLRFIMQRAVKYGLMIPTCLRMAFDPDKGRYNTFDTMKAWSGFKGWAKLKDMSRELFGDESTDIDGADVAATWAVDPTKVIEHCRQDVERTRRLYYAIAKTLWGE